MNWIHQSFRVHGGYHYRFHRTDSPPGSPTTGPFRRKIGVAKFLLLSLLPWINQIFPNLWLQSNVVGYYLEVLEPEDSKLAASTAITSNLKSSYMPAFAIVFSATTGETVTTNLDKPRIVYLDSSFRENPSLPNNRTGHDRNLHMDLRHHEVRKYTRYTPHLCRGKGPDCRVPAGGRWQYQNYVTCNLIHEIPLPHEYQIVAKGGKRLVWKVSDSIDDSEDEVEKNNDTFTANDTRTSAKKTPSSSGLVALKMFQYRRNREDDFGPMTMELQRRDAIIHEQMTKSPHIVDIYGFCGASAIYEFAQGGNLQEVVQQQGALTGTNLLQTAHRIVSSVADVHHYSSRSGEAQIAHADIYGPQWVQVNGEFKLTDMNLAKLLVTSKVTKKVIPFRRDVVDNWFAPEVHRQGNITKDIVTEKMDVWNMGNVMYMILMGQAPFQGLNRWTVHKLIMERQQLRPEIPSTIRHSNDWAQRVVAQAIDMCMVEDPTFRPKASEVRQFFKKPMKVLKKYGFNATLVNDRVRRFPSIKERVKRYMGSWYASPCRDNKEALVQYQILPPNETRPDSVLVEGLSHHRQKIVVRLDAEIKTDDAMLLNPQEMMLSYNETSPHAGYRHDVATTILPFHNGTIQGLPLVTQWGDKTTFWSTSIPELVMYNVSFAIPHLKKCRRSFTKAEIMELTSNTNCVGRRRGPKRTRTQPIIWKLDSNRLLGDARKIHKLDKPWSEKLSKAVFRGALTGHALYTGGREKVDPQNVTEEEFCGYIERCRFVVRYYDSAFVDAKLTDLMGKPLNATLNGIPLLGDKMSVQELLNNKMLILLEGNDVPSGLAWSLMSNSVVMMRPPTFTSWLMEEMLVPWVHYVPIDSSFDDVEEKVQWVLKNDQQAEEIALRGRLWVLDLLDHPDANQENMEIFRRILDRYVKLFTPSNQLLPAYDALVQLGVDNATELPASLNDTDLGNSMPVEGR